MTSILTIEQITGQTEQHIQWLADNIGLHRQVIEPWNSLCEAAKKQGFDLQIASGFRSFERQKSIWNKKCSGELKIKNLDNQIINTKSLSEEEIIFSILTFSALPSLSRHHWGTDLDFYSPSLLVGEQNLLLEPWEYQASGPFTALTEWLKINAHNFGFYFPYDKYRGGIAAEPWHLSYFPLAQKFEKKIDENLLSQIIKNSDIIFKDHIIAKLDIILTMYVFNIGQVSHG